MGGSPSKEPTDDLVDRCLTGAQQRLLAKNFQLLASQATDDTSSFNLDDWRSLHAGSAPVLADAVFRVVVAGDSTASYDGTRRAVASACDPSGAPGLLLFDAFAGEGGSGWLALAVDALHAEALVWLRATSELAGDAHWLPEAEGALLLLDQPLPQRPPPDDREAFGAWAAEHPSSSSAARLFALLLAASWLVDHRLLLPLPTLHEGPSALLEEPLLRAITNALPPRHRKRWRLVFASARDGASYARFVKLCVGRAPTLLLVRDKQGATFGGFCSQSLRLSPRWFGDHGCFLFSVASGSARIFHPTAENEHFVYMNAHAEQLPNGIAFGGQLDERFFGLWLRHDLESGRSDAMSATYRNQGLARTTEFEVGAVEVWAVNDDPVAPSAAEGGGVRSKEHAEAAAFMELAGRRPHAEALEPPPTE